MIKQLKTLALAIGLVAGLSLASTSFAAKPKEAAPAAPAATAPAPAPEAAAPAAAVATPAAAPSAHEENPYGLSALWGPRRHCGQGYFAHLGAHVHGLLVRDHHQVL